jgi:hypothetical protein
MLMPSWRAWIVTLAAFWKPPTEKITSGAAARILVRCSVKSVSLRSKYSVATIDAPSFLKASP